MSEPTTIQLMERRHGSLDGLQAGTDIFLHDGGGDFEGHYVLDDHAGGGDRADVGAFVGRRLRKLGCHVDGWPASGQGTDRLLGGADDNRLAVGCSALDASRVIRRPPKAEAPIGLRMVRLKIVWV